ncbi:protein TolR [Methylomicrobium album]|uniref:Tol-Pal system protein TolR n=1 Tax=Methylomicrobium album BG8 TaxID=686340 RepID=H8GL27_METAL|nr:protein TolR [Methylomicrobium album]EIC30508.1 TolR protein [Methylomicrobium album BG8]
MNRKNGRRRKPMSEINVVPYIDVTLVLLIIFMITTPLLQTGVKVDLPEAESAVVEPKNDPPLVLTIHKEPAGDYKYFIMCCDKEQEPIEPEEVDGRVSAVLAEKPETQVLIEADRDVDYGTVVTMMAGMKNSGVPNVGLLTRPEEN